MRFHDLTGDGQSHAGPWNTITVDGESVELFKDPRPLRFRNPRAVISDADYETFSIGASADLDRGWGGRILERVVYQLPNRELHEFSVYGNAGQAAGQV